MAPAWVAWVIFKNANSLARREGFASAVVEHYILENGIRRTIVAFEFRSHVPKPILAHVKVGAVEPMGIGVLIGDKHFRHGDLVGDRSEPVAGNDPHIIKDRLASDQNADGIASSASRSDFPKR